MSAAWLITGCKGQPGSEQSRQALRASDIPFARGIDLLEVDLTDPFAVRDTIEELGADPARVLPTDAASYPTPATRPAHSMMSGAVWDGAGCRRFLGWCEALVEAFRIEGDALRGPLTPE